MVVKVCDVETATVDSAVAVSDCGGRVIPGVVSLVEKLPFFAAVEVEDDHIVDSRGVMFGGDPRVLLS